MRRARFDVNGLPRRRRLSHSAQTWEHELDGAVSRRKLTAMTTAAERVVIDLVSYAQRSTDEQLMVRIDDTIDVAHRIRVHALVLILLGMIDDGGAETWNGVVQRLALNDN